MPSNNHLFKDSFYVYVITVAGPTITLNKRHENLPSVLPSLFGAGPFRLGPIPPPIGETICDVNAEPMVEVEVRSVSTDPISPTISPPNLLLVASSPTI